MLKNSQVRKQATILGVNKKSADVEFEGIQAVAQKILEGVYELQFLKAERRELWVPKLFLWFRVISFGEFHGAELFMCCPIPKNNKWGVGTKFIRSWAIAAGRLPDRFDRVSTKIFYEKVFSAQVRTVVVDYNQQKLPEGAQYSVVDRLISRIQ
ncbi:MAG: hypothetical protein KC584_07985 [Nitrospira sp.]|nr:hypothetical protein [Nitrospira sp.]